MLFRTSDDYKDWELKKLANSAGFKRIERYELKMSLHKLYKPVKGCGDKPNTKFETRESIEYRFTINTPGDPYSSDSDSETLQDPNFKELAQEPSFNQIGE